MTLTDDMVAKVYDTITEKFDEIRFFQDQIVIVDERKSTWDTAIKRLDNQLLGEIKVVNDAIDDIKDAYNVRFTGVNSCRTDLFWMVTDQGSTGAGQVTYDLLCVKLNETGYTDIVRENVGVGSTFFSYVDAATAGILTAPTNTVTAQEQERDVGDILFGFEPTDYWGIKYYDEPYARDIGDTFVTSFIGTIAMGSNQLTVMNPIMSTGEDSGNSILEVGQIVSCGKTGVFVTTTKISGISTGFADLSQIPTTGIGSTDHSPVNILSLTATTGVAVSTFDSISFRVLDNPDSGPAYSVGDVTSNGNNYTPNTFGGKDHPWVQIPGTASLGGSGALFYVLVNDAGGIETVAVDVVGQGGIGYSDGEVITITGDKIGGSTPTDDISFPVQLSPDPQGRFRYQLKMGDNMDLWVDPFVPQTIGIMDSDTVGLGVSIIVDHSGEPSGSQSWNSQLLGFEMPMDPNNLEVLTKVEAPLVGSDKSYAKVGFQAAPWLGTGSPLAYEGQALSSVQVGYLSGRLKTLDACSSAVDDSITAAKADATAKGNAFEAETGEHDLLVNAANGLRGERNQLCQQIWGMRQSIGQVNERITQLEGIKSYIDYARVDEVVNGTNS